MFTTFVGMPLSGNVLAPGNSPRHRQKKRSQVARACDWCRVHRTKCDNDRPCSNCRSRGGSCGNTGEMKSTTLPHAFREIERLSKRVQELELELELQKQHKVGSDPPVHQLDTPSILPIVQRTSDDRDPDTRDPRLTQGCDRMKVHCEGIYLRTARSPQKTWYGSSSIFCFIGRINAFLTLAFQQTHSAQGMLPNAASKLLNAPTSVPGEGYSQVSRLVAIPVDDPINAGDYLTPTQEEYFLGLFWQTYNTSCPILDELEFKDTTSPCGQHQTGSENLPHWLTLSLQCAYSMAWRSCRRLHADPLALPQELS